MIKLEILELRTNQKENAVIDQKIKEFVQDFQAKNANSLISIYRNEIISSDYSIHIKYDQRDRPEYHELLIDEINEVLGRYGMLYHSTWINMYKISRGKRQQINGRNLL